MWWMVGVWRVPHLLGQIDDVIEKERKPRRGGLLEENPRIVKYEEGRKTDVKDCLSRGKWIINWTDIISAIWFRISRV